MEETTEILLAEFLAIYDRIAPWPNISDEKLAEIALRILEMKEKKDKGKSNE